MSTDKKVFNFIPVILFLLIGTAGYLIYYYFFKALPENKKAPLSTYTQDVSYDNVVYPQQVVYKYEGNITETTLPDGTVIRWNDEDKIWVKYTA